MKPFKPFTSHDFITIFSLNSTLMLLSPSCQSYTDWKLLSWYKRGQCFDFGIGQTSRKFTCECFERNNANLKLTSIYDCDNMTSKTITITVIVWGLKIVRFKYNLQLSSVEGGYYSYTPKPNTHHTNSRTDKLTFLPPLKSIETFPSIQRWKQNFRAKLWLNCYQVKYRLHLIIQIIAHNLIA